MSSASYSRFDDETSYRAQLQAVFALAESDVCILDRSLAGMRIESATFREALSEFLSRSAKHSVRIALHDTQPVRTDMPRFLGLAQRYAHNLKVRQIPDEYRHLSDCHLLVDARHGVRRFHVDQARGALILDDPQEIRPWWNRFDELWELSLPVDLTGTTGL